MDNLAIYNATRKPPQNALKTIKGGRLSGYTDINPMWRIKVLTEQFGPCGIGWKYIITKQWLEEGANGEIAAFTNIDLYIKWNGEWSEAIPGTGGSAFVAKERSGLYTSDECFKMALTDAISVACKSLGMAADIYWESDKTKYDRPENKVDTSKNDTPKYIGKSEAIILKGLITKTGTDQKKFLDYYKVDKPEQMTKEMYEHAISILKKKNTTA
jgi:hypothetical protein